MTPSSKNPETLVLHAGPRSDGATGAVAVPICQTTSYQFRSTEHAASLVSVMIAAPADRLRRDEAPSNRPRTVRSMVIFVSWIPNAAPYH